MSANITRESHSMRVSIETISGLERKMTIGVPAERVDGAVAKKLREAARKAANQRVFVPAKCP